MPDGATHFKLWRGGLALIPPVSFIVYETASRMGLKYLCSDSGLCFAGHGSMTIGITLGYLYGAFVDPDMDIVGMTQAEGRMMRKLGIVGGALVAYWTFYGYLFRKYHRSFWTHGPVISTAIRYCYQFWLPWIYIYNSSQDHSWLVYGFIGMFIGTTVSDIIHFLADKASGELKRR
jgi:uncharacterized metal-binding protein